MCEIISFFNKCEKIVIYIKQCKVQKNNNYNNFEKLQNNLLFYFIFSILNFSSILFSRFTNSQGKSSKKQKNLNF